MRMINIGRVESEHKKIILGSFIIIIIILLILYFVIGFCQAALHVEMPDVFKDFCYQNRSLLIDETWLSDHGFELIENGWRTAEYTLPLGRGVAVFSIVEQESKAAVSALTDQLSFSVEGHKEYYPSMRFVFWPLGEGYRTYEYSYLVNDKEFFKIQVVSDTISLPERIEYEIYQWLTENK